jgi:hypothetical protein
MPTPVSLQRDLNFVAVAGGVLDDGSGTIAPLSIQASTGRLKVTAIGISGSGVSKIIAGTGISVSPVGGTGNVTITASGGGVWHTPPESPLPDGSVVQYTVGTSAPTDVIADGTTLFEGHGYTYSSPYITLDNGATQFVRFR